MSGVTTHVLDIANGQVAPGVRIELWAENNGTFRLLKTLNTNVQGRTDAPLLEGPEMKSGRYQLVFDIGAYYAQFASARGKPFFGRVPVRFTIHRPDEHYHVPLLAAPWGYQSYRGS